MQKNKINKGTVYVVHAVDTEGPLYESLEANFQRIYEHYGIKIYPSKKNLELIQKKKIKLPNNLKEKISALVNKSMLNRLLGSWDQIDKMHETLMSKKWRLKLKDSYNKGYVFSWHCMDHVYFENNPRRKAMGFHAVFEHYKNLLNFYDIERDKIYFHFHPPSLSRDSHRQSCGFNINMLHNEILARRIIDHSWFPSCFRPGGHMETGDINFWLENWIPFDLGHQNVEDPQEILKIHPIPGRFVDWRGAPTDWTIYHPDFYNHRKIGKMKRWIARCLNIQTRYNNIDLHEMKKAFRQANDGKNVLVSITNHDFRDMIKEVEQFVKLVKKANKFFPKVKFKWANSVEGFRGALKLKKSKPINFKIKMSKNYVVVKSDKKIWGPQPFLALRTHEGKYYRDDMIIDKNNTWKYPFDVHTISKNALSHLGIASNDELGNTTVAVYNFKTKKIFQNFLNDKCYI